MVVTTKVEGGGDGADKHEYHEDRDGEAGGEEAASVAVLGKGHEAAVIVVANLVGGITLAEGGVDLAGAASRAAAIGDGDVDEGGSKGDIENHVDK